MSSTHRYRLVPRLGLAALVCLGAVATAPLAAVADPPGNNGTVKIAQLGDFDKIPNNAPHVGCTFDVEWYGFDEGPDLFSTVSFAEQAPTTGVGLSVDGPARVFVGGDPATGAGTPTGLDAKATYTLSFTGAPHPQQGYHLKLTISTPRSNGNNTKSKVFWVKGCEPTPPTPDPTDPPTPDPTDPPTPDPTDPPTEQPTEQPKEQPTTPATPLPTQDPEVLPAQASEETDAPDVLGEQASGEDDDSSAGTDDAGTDDAGTDDAGSDDDGTAPEVLGAAAQQQPLPTAVNAGLRASAAPVGPDAVQVLVGLMTLLLGGAVARLGWRRARA